MVSGWFMISKGKRELTREDMSRMITVRGFIGMALGFAVLPAGCVLGVTYFGGRESLRRDLTPVRVEVDEDRATIVRNDSTRYDLPCVDWDDSWEKCVRYGLP